MHPKLVQVFSTAESEALGLGGGRLGPSVKPWPTAAFSSRGADVRLAGQDTPPGNLRASQRRGRRLPDRYGVHPAGRHGTGALLDLRLAAVRICRLGLRVRLLVDRPRRAGGMGGPVRRLRQRSPDHHRPVPRRGRDQVGARRRGLDPQASPAWTTKARAPSTPRPGWNASWISPPRTTCRSPT